MTIKKENKLIAVFFICVCVCLLCMAMISLGRISMKRDVKESIMSQYKVGRVIKVTELGMTVIPFEKGFIYFDDAKKEMMAEETKHFADQVKR